MGLGLEAAHLFLNEHKLRPLTGKLLMVGRPATWFSPELAMQLIEQSGVRINPGVSIEIDTSTVAAKSQPGQRWITDKSFFALFCDAEVVAVDVSDFEGAEIVHDMTTPIPSALEGQFSLLFDGSSLDNIFDPVTALRNYIRCLEPNGRLIAQNMGSPHSGPYLMYSGEWFADYFLLNRFADFKIYLGYFDTQFEDDIAVRTYGWEPFVPEGERWRAVTSQMYPRLPPGTANVAVVVVAEKRPETSWNLSPVQYLYRAAPYSADWMRYLDCFLEMRQSRRGWITHGEDKSYAFATPPGFTYLGTRRRVPDPWAAVSKGMPIETNSGRDVDKQTRPNPEQELPPGDSRSSAPALNQVSGWELQRELVRRYRRKLRHFFAPH